MTATTVRTWIGWWIAAFVLWLLLTSTVVGSELVAGIVAATITAVAAASVHAVDPQPAPRARVAFRALAVLPWRAVVDTGLLVAVLVRRLVGRAPGAAVGRFVELPDPTSAADAGGRRGRRTADTILVGATPNQYVVDFTDGVAWVHELAPRGHGSLAEITGAAAGGAQS